MIRKQQVERDAVQPRLFPGFPLVGRQSLLAASAALAVLAGVTTPARAQTSENVAVVVNDLSPDSQRIGEYYAKVRSLPPSNVLHIRTSTEETIDRAVYSQSIEQPLINAIAKGTLQDKVLYLVLTKGVPLRVAGTAGQAGTIASVDSELTLLYRIMTGQSIRLEGPVANPYFLGDRETSEAKPFTHRNHDIFLVSRLDGFTFDEVKDLIDRGSAPRAEGRFVLDQRDALVNRVGENWLELASKRLTAEPHGTQVVLETTTKPARDLTQVLGYFSWGSIDPQNRVRSTGLGFTPGAIAASFVGTGARTFRAPPETWVPTGDAGVRGGTYAGTPESLVGDLIRDGVTGAAGYVAEPFLNGTVRPQILFPAYVAGFNLIESYYLAIPHLGWETIVIGDPLCAPFPRTALSRADIDDGLDEVTEMPALFSKRRMEIEISRWGDTPERALALTLRSTTMALRGDIGATRAALEEAVKLAPKYVPALMLLSSFDEQAENHDQAIERYQQILEVQPNNPIALNNLAYGLAVYRNMPMEALPYARRAVAQAPTNLALLDTLGWIQHLLGDDASAVKVMAQIARANIPVASIRLHAAIVFAAQGARAVAQNELNAALKLNPELEKTNDVKQLRVTLAPAPAPASAPGSAAPPAGGPGRR